MASIKLYELLGITKERADEIARKVRDSFAQSDTPEEWIGRLIEEFDVDRSNADIFACRVVCRKVRRSIRGLQCGAKRD